jgi:hypothetical protein
MPAQTALHRIAEDPGTIQPIATPFQTSLPGLTCQRHNETEAGFLRLKVTKDKIVCDCYATGFNGFPQRAKERRETLVARRRS